MNRKQRDGFWWAAAFLLPILPIGIGILNGLAAPRRDSDWFGGTLLIPIIIGILIGCIASCAASAISFLRRERLFPASLLIAIPAAGLLMYSVIAFERSKIERQRQAAINVVSYKNSEERMKRIASWKVRFCEHPDLITTDGVWAQNRESKAEAEWGLNWALQETDFNVTPEIKEFVIRKTPQNASLVFTKGRSTHEELKRLFHDRTVSYEVREQAIDCLMRDQDYKLTEEEKMIVFVEFATKYTLLFGTKQFTRTELEEMVRDSKIPEYIRREAQQYLKWQSYKEEEIRPIQLPRG